MAVTEGGIIGKQNPSTTTSASGMWSTNEVFLRNTVANEWPSFNAPVTEYNVLGGGGAGAAFATGGGGSGAVLMQGNFAPLGGITYAITIGAGGIGGNGGASSIGSFVTGNGGRFLHADAGADNDLYSGGSGLTYGGGGGAGAGGDGNDAPRLATGAAGGIGIAMPLHPSNLRGGGGGGGGGTTSYGGGGSGAAVDGGGSWIGSSGNAGAANRGGGGGHQSPGGSGRVVLRYPDSFPAAQATTGTVTITVSGGYRHYDFTSTGSITF